MFQPYLAMMCSLILCSRMDRQLLVARLMEIFA